VTVALQAVLVRCATQFGFEQVCESVLPHADEVISIVCAEGQMIEIVFVSRSQATMRFSWGAVGDWPFDPRAPNKRKKANNLSVFVGIEGFNSSSPLHSQ